MLLVRRQTGRPWEVATPTRMPPRSGAIREVLVVTGSCGPRARGECHCPEPGEVESTTTLPSVRTAASQSRPETSTVVAGEE